MNSSYPGHMRIDELLQNGRERGASDLHFAADESPSLRVDGALVRRPDISLSAAEIDRFLSDRLDAQARAALRERGSCDVILRGAGTGSVRLHVFRGSGGIRFAARLLYDAVPSLQSWDLPPAIERIVLRRSGLILVVGPTGSGKTTLLASMIDALNTCSARVIVTLEDPIEYLHFSDKSQIAQCEVGRDVPDFASAIVDVLRADPDVIVIGELRDTESFRSALTAAETGHLILASLHTIDAPQALERIVDSFPADARHQVRVQLAQTLASIIALRLVPKALGNGRRAAAEVLIATDAVRNLIREGKTHQLRSVMQTSRAYAMQTLEMHLADLLARGEITQKAAVEVAERPSELVAAVDSR